MLSDSHGKVFEGKACRVMLEKADQMMNRAVLRDISPLVVLPYVRAYKAMDKLVHACFSTRVVTEDVDKLLQEVVVSYMALGLCHSSDACNNRE